MKPALIIQYAGSDISGNSDFTRRFSLEGEKSSELNSGFLPTRLSGLIHIALSSGPLCWMMSRLRFKAESNSSPYPGCLSLLVGKPRRATLTLMPHMLLVPSIPKHRLLCSRTLALSGQKILPTLCRCDFCKTNGNHQHHRHQSTVLIGAQVLCLGMTNNLTLGCR